MPDPLELLRLTADLHAAARDPERWPQVWAALAAWFDCPQHFIDPHGEPEWPAFLAGRCADAGHCARTSGGACGQGPLADESKRQACLIAVDHLGHALAAVGAKTSAAPSPVAAPTMAALDALPVPLLLCRPDRRLVFANRPAQRELDRQRWLSVREGLVVLPDGRQDRRLAAALAGFAQPAGPDEYWLEAVPERGEMADYALRRLAPGGTDDSDALQAEESDELILLSVILHADAPPPELLDRIGERRRLPPRQRELAGLLLAGLSLDAAAERMGIGRRTARDHLSGLFRATGTSRQSELIARLSRETLG